MEWDHEVTCPFFVKNFDSDRTFSVKLLLDTVTFLDILIQAKGVPQGNVLSPTLFLCMVNDLLPAPPRNLKHSLYADDCVISHSRCRVELSVILIHLALYLVPKWGLQWELSFGDFSSLEETRRPADYGQSSITCSKLC